MPNKNVDCSMSSPNHQSLVLNNHALDMVKTCSTHAPVMLHSCSGHAPVMLLLYLVMLQTSYVHALVIL